MSTLFCPQHLPMCTSAFDLKGAAVLGVTEVLRVHSSFARKAIIIHPQIFRIAGP